MIRLHAISILAAIFLLTAHIPATIYADTSDGMNLATADSTSTTNLGLDARQYYNRGYKTASGDYWGVLPFATGVITGMTLPVATGAGAAAGYQAHEAVSVFTGAGAFGLWLWSGGTIAHKMPVPVPENHLTGHSETERQSFVTGYKQGIADRRRATYIFGIIAGLGVDLYILHLIFADFHGFGV